MKPSNPRVTITAMLTAALALMLMLPPEAPGYGTQRQRNAGLPADWLPDAMDLEVTDRLGERIPLDITLVDGAGREVTLGRLLDGERPVVLNLGYYQCPSLCTVMLNKLLDAVRDMAWTPGQEYTILTVSFDPREGPELARAKKQAYINELGRPEAAGGWHFLTGSETEVDRLREAVGFPIKWDDRLGEWAHPGVLVLLSGEGKVSRYLDLQVDAAALRMGLNEAKRGNVGVLDLIFSVCFAWDPQRGAYTLQAVGLMKVGGALTVVVLGGVIATALWREHRRRRRAAGAVSGGANVPSVSGVVDGGRY